MITMLTSQSLFSKIVPEFLWKMFTPGRRICMGNPISRLPQLLERGMPPLMAERKKPKADADAKSKHSIGVRVSDQLLAALDEYIGRQEVPPERPAVLRKALEDFLAAKGFWKSNSHT